MSMKSASADAEALVTNLSDTATATWLNSVSTTLSRIDKSAATLEQISAAALSGAQNIESLTGGETKAKIMLLLDDIEIIRKNLEIASEAVIVASNNAADLSDISEDRIDAFLQKLENAALNVEEMTARLRDDPSIIIRGSN